MFANLPVCLLRAMLLAMLLSASVGSLRAGPLEGSALGASSPAGDAAAQLLPPLGLPEVGNAAAAVPSRSAASQAARGSALAVELMRESGVDPSDRRRAAQGGAASAAESPQPRPTARATEGQWDDSEIPAEVRSMGKAAVNWFKGMLPWMSDDVAASPETEINWSSGPSRHAGGAAALLLEGAGNAAAKGASGRSGADETAPANGQANLLRDGIEAAKEVVSHPMTWLIVALCAIGAVAVSLADRRPK